MSHDHALLSNTCSASTVPRRTDAGSFGPRRPDRGTVVEAWRRRDIPSLAALLAEDAILRMPPQRAEFAGRDTIVDVLATVPAGGRLDLIDLVVVRANRQPALAAYLPEEWGECQGYGITVLDIAGGAIVTITGFPDAALFAAFGLPTSRPSRGESAGRVRWCAGRASGVRARTGRAWSARHGTSRAEVTTAGRRYTRTR